MVPVGAIRPTALLANGGVAVMPGASFGDIVSDWVQVSLTVDDDRFGAACDRIVAHARLLS